MNDSGQLIWISRKDAPGNIITSLLISGMQMLEHLEFSWCPVGLLNWPMITQSSPDPFHVLIGAMTVRNQSIPDRARLNLQLLQQHQHQVQPRPNQQQLRRLQRQQRKLRHAKTNAMMHTSYVLMGATRSPSASQNVAELISTV